MTLHPRERRRLPRRRFIRLSALGAAAAGLAPAAARRLRRRRRRRRRRRGRRAGSSCRVPTTRRRCRRSTTTRRSPTACRSRAGTLKVYNYEEYISPDVLAAFEEEYGVTVEVTTFTSMDEAVAKLASGEVDVRRLLPDARPRRPARRRQAAAAAEQDVPARTWPTCGSRCRTRSTTRAACTRCRTRSTRRASATASTPWPRRPTPTRTPTTSSGTPPTPARCTCSRTTARCSAWRCSGAIPTPTSTPRTPSVVDAALADVTELTDLVNVKVGAEAYTVLPEKRAWVHQCWSGDVVNAQYYLPEGETIDEHRLLVPARRRRHRRQRHHRRPAQRDQAGAGPHVPQLPARRRPTPWRTTPGSATSRRRRRSTPTASSPTGTCRPTWRTRSSVRRTSTPASSCCSCRSPASGRGTTPGRRSRRAADIDRRVDADGAVGCGRRSPRPACCGSSPCSSSPSTACWPSPSAASTRSSATPCRCGTRCSGASTRSARSSSGSSRPSSARSSCAPRSYVGAALSICFLIGYPVAYYVARFAGRRRGLLLALLLAPFWINYLMRMLAWVNLLQADGYVNDVTAAVGLGRVNWLDGRAFTVVHRAWSTATCRSSCCPLYAALDRIDGRMLEASRDLGDGPGGDVRAGDAADVAPGDARRGGASRRCR